MSADMWRPQGHRNTTCQNEDPWDSTERGPARRFLAASLVFVMAMLLSSNSALAQLAPIHPSDADLRARQVELSDEQKELADEYLALVEDIRRLADEYGEYYAIFGAKQAQTSAKALLELRTRLASENYTQSYELLLKDMAKLQAVVRIKQGKADAQNGSADNDMTTEAVNPKLYRLSKSLNRELDIMRDLLSDEIVVRLQKDRALAKTIQAYVRQSLASKRSGVVVVDDWLAPDVSGSSDWALLEDGAMGILPAPEAPPAPPAPPLLLYSNSSRKPGHIYIGGRDRIFVGQSGGHGHARELSDSVKAPSDGSPVIVVNPIGELNVEPWSKSWIMARSIVQVSARTPELAKKTITLTDLRLYVKGDAVYVESVMPSLSDPHVKIESASLDIRAPATARLVCNSSHGTVNIAGFEGGAKLNCEDTELDVSFMQGGLDVVSSVGDVLLDNIDGHIFVRNSDGPVELTDCRGDLEIENSLAAITLRSCFGGAVLRNTGSVSVRKYSGNIRVENQNGAIDMRDIDGNVTATTSFRAMTVRDVSGSARLESKLGSISVQDVYGPVSVRSVKGSVAARSLSDSIDIVTSHGSVTLVADEALTERSSVRADYGSITLHLSGASNVDLSIENRGGEIEATLPINLTKTAGVEYGTLTLGNGFTPLEVFGNHSRIAVHSLQ